MYSKEAGSYDVIPEGLKRYINMMAMIKYILSLIQKKL